MPFIGYLFKRSYDNLGCFFSNVFLDSCSFMWVPSFYKNTECVANILATKWKKNLRIYVLWIIFLKNKPKHKTGCVDILIVELHNLLICKLFIFFKNCSYPHIWWNKFWKKINFGICKVCVCVWSFFVFLRLSLMLLRSHGWIKVLNLIVWRAWNRQAQGSVACCRCSFFLNQKILVLIVAFWFL